ncbi:hypothetical protein AGR1A_Lc90024 [Agrobacterium fabacearum CFBP 5771]|nr:hypothetical protein AGR1A_Lc90024 [Agrobacterium fabacearum CFBP 5771]
MGGSGKAGEGRRTCRSRHACCVFGTCGKTLDHSARISLRLGLSVTALAAAIASSGGAL